MGFVAAYRELYRERRASWNFLDVFLSEAHDRKVEYWNLHCFIVGFPNLRVKWSARSITFSWSVSLFTL